MQLLLLNQCDLSYSFFAFYLFWISLSIKNSICFQVNQISYTDFQFKLQLENNDYESISSMDIGDSNPEPLAHKTNTNQWTSHLITRKQVYGFCFHKFPPIEWIKKFMKYVDHIVDTQPSGMSLGLCVGIQYTGMRCPF